VFDEIGCLTCVEDIAEILAAIVAEDMIVAFGPAKAARKVENQLAKVLDFAHGAHDGND
jgi:hypothetical protein